MASIPPGTVLAGKYRVTKVLGEGGMGVVVAAVHVQLDEPVALKFMLPSALGSPEAVGRFLREARAAVKLKSEHVARVSDVGTLEDGAPYIVMEYLEGTDLAGVLTTRGALPAEEAVEYILQACDALAEAHSLGIVHRDLKPANLFLTQRRDGSPLVKVLDFGISKSSTLNEAGGAALTKTGGLMGSPMYMSPEQMKSAKDADARTDVWSLGVILYELVGGRTPFDSDTLGGLMAQVLTEPAPPLGALRPDLPAPLYEVIHRCLEKDRANRYANVAELAAALGPLAPPRAQILVPRIAGVLGQSRADGADVRVTGSLTGGPRASMPSAGAFSSSASPGQVVAPVATAPNATAPGWSETSGGARPKGGKGVIAGAIAALAAVAIAFVLFRGAHEPPPATATTVEHPASPPPAPPPAETPPAAPLAPLPAAPTALPVVETAPATTAASPAPAPKPGAGHAAPSRKHGPATPAAPATSTPAPHPTPAKPSNDILDTSN
ncbi:MAG TPA: serine/threonine-protein kinase [Polyangiaceae bacterium]|jgi:serine/threonine-protein kinase